MPDVQIKENKKEDDRLSAYLPGFTAGTLSLFARHPLDTAASRIKASRNFTYSEWQKIIFPDKMHKFSSLYRGIGAASLNRGSQLISMELQNPFEKYMNSRLKALGHANDSISQAIVRGFTSVSFGTFTALLACVPNQYKISRQLGTKVINPIYALPPTIYRNTAWFLVHSLSEKPVHFAVNSINIFEKNENARQSLENFSTAMIASFLSVPFDRCKILIQSGQLPPGTIKAFSHILKQRTLFQGSGMECVLQLTGVGLFYATKATTKTVLDYKKTIKNHLEPPNRAPTKT